MSTDSSSTGLSSTDLSITDSSSTDSAAQVVAVIDVGGTDTKIGYIDGAGDLADATSVPTPVAEPVAGIVDLCANHVEALRGRGLDVAALGLVVPGFVDSLAGIAIYASNLGWRDVPFVELLRERLGIPVALGHDVASAGLAELHAGAAAGYDDAAVVVLGTGIAAALFADGKPLRGRGYAGELGHTPVPGGEACNCGMFGCLESLAGGWGITKRYNAKASASAHASASAEGRADATHVAQVLAAADAGDEHAAAVWADACAALGQAVGILSALVAPQVVVFGGGLSRAGDRLLDPIREHVDTLITAKPELKLTALGPHAGLIGAGILASRAADENTQAAGPTQDPR